MKYSRKDAKDFAQENFRGIFAANLTPFTADGAPDEEGLRRNMRHWVDDLEIAGLFINGKQAEFFSMSITERKQQFDIVVDEVGDRCRTVLSCSDETWIPCWNWASTRRILAPTGSLFMRRRSISTTTWIRY